MALPKIVLPGDILIQPEPLTPAAFAPFGTVIAPPFASSLSKYPRTTLTDPHDWNDRRQPLPIPAPLFPEQQVQAIAANQSTALKTSPVSPLANNYPSATPHNPSSQGQMSIFSCFPRENVYQICGPAGDDVPRCRLKLGILERHPFTTQTFCPFNYSSLPAASTSHSDRQGRNTAVRLKTYMVVVVAPTIPDPMASPPNPPDLTRVRCFIARLHGPEDPKMAVTYNPGMWHAPMIVLGDRRVDFLVTQFANGVAEDDCQEVLIGTGPDEACPTSYELYLRWKEGGLMTDKEAEIDVSFIRRDVVEDDQDETNGAALQAAAKDSSSSVTIKTSKL